MAQLDINAPMWRSPLDGQLKNRGQLRQPDRDALRAIGQEQAPIYPISNYNGWRQIAIDKPTQRDILDLMAAMPPNALTIVVGYGVAKGGDSYDAGQTGWMTVQSKDWARHAGSPLKNQERGAGFRLFDGNQPNQIIIRYGVVRS